MVRYSSPDSAPAGYSVVRSAWTGPAFLVTFALATAALVPLLPRLADLYARALEGVLGAPLGPSAAEGLSLRPFLAALMAALGLFAPGSLRRRLSLTISLLGMYLGGVFLADLLLGNWALAGGPSPFSGAGAVAISLVAAVVIIVGVFTRYQLPSGVQVAARIVRSRAILIFGGLTLAVTLALAVTLSRVVGRHLRAMAEIPLLGGLGSEVVLVTVVLTIALFAYAAAQRRRIKPSEGPLLSVAFVVPAHNEEGAIESCIASLDDAAGAYSGRCRLYVVENGSSDRTAKVGAEALARCTRLTGRVLRSRKRGKAHALNLGLRHSSEDLVVRVDADSLVEPALLPKLVPYFWNPGVGGVAGLPLPRDRRSWIGLMRTMEVYYNVAVKRCVQNALNAVMVLPGFMVAYRRHLLLDLGGYAPGINGEDADMTVRIGRLGYRIISDPSIHAFTEVPATIGHLREQRMRWARGMFHMASRNRSTVSMLQGPRGVVMLPWALWSAARKAMLLPLVACLGIVSLLDSTLLSVGDLATIGTTVVGLQVVLMVGILLAYRQLGPLLVAPTFLVFRLMLIYFSLESFLSLPLRADISDERGRALSRLAKRISALRSASPLVLALPEAASTALPQGRATAVPAPPKADSSRPARSRETGDQTSRDPPPMEPLRAAANETEPDRTAREV